MRFREATQRSFRCADPTQEIPYAVLNELFLERTEIIREVWTPFLHEVQNGECPHCDRPLVPLDATAEERLARAMKKGSNAKNSIEHVIPRSKGGPTLVTNLILAHCKCNSRKGNQEPSQRELDMLAKAVQQLAFREDLWPALKMLMPDWVYVPEVATAS